jgi:beta-glucuronidase
MKRLLASVLLAAGAAGALAQDLRPPLLLTGAHAREGQDLSGRWTYSKDLYRTGLTDINGWVAKSRMQRHRDVDVAAEEAKGGTAFFEFDLDRGPVMELPGAWNAASPELRYYDGLIWFQRRFEAQAKPGQRSFLRFEAVNYRAHVYLNGREIGRHEGGFTPFVLEVTQALRAGDNRLTVGVDSQHDAQSIPTAVTDWDNYGGITRPVKLLHTPATFIDDATLRLTDDGRLVGSARLNGTQAARQTVTLEIAALGLRVQASTDANGEARFDVPAPAALQRWSPESPRLYELRFSTAADVITERIGFRTVAVRGTQILLNGQPIFLRGVSLHEEEIGANPARRITDAAARALLSEVKQGLNGNYVRLSHYPHSEAMQRAADELGLLVWAEIPVYWTADWHNPAVLEKARRMLAEAIYRDRNRAAVVLWSVGNETPVAPERTRFHAALADTVRALDNSRLVSAALLLERKQENGRAVIRIADPLLPQLDVMAVNSYAGWYGDDRLEDLQKLQWDLPTDKPLLLSEFGADALAGFHDGSATPRKFSEEFQAAYYRATLAMAARLPQLQGLSPWVLKDFRSPRREHPVYQNGWNRKGLISETGQRKLAFEVLATNYRERAAMGTGFDTGFDVAITVDDLPVHGQLPRGRSWLAVHQELLRGFAAERVPQAWGFVNGGHLEQQPALGAVLDAWRGAGHPLGNHGQHHVNLNTVPAIEAWQLDVVAGETAVLQRMPADAARYFRFAYLAAGRDAAQQAAALAFLDTRRWKVADVSLSFDDWAYTDAWARCSDRGDSAALATLKAQYLRDVDDALRRMKALSQRVHGRVVPQVLLAHAGAFTADLLPETLQRLRAAGARFVTLEQAQADPAYVQAGGGGVLERTAQQRGISLDGLPPAPAGPPAAALCR